MAKRNVHNCVSILADYKNLSEEVEELSLRLQTDDTSELADVYRKLKRFLFLHKKLIERVNKQQGYSREQVQHVEAKFAKVFEVQGAFNRRCFDVVRKHYTLARSRPVDIVRVMRIIMNEAVASQAAAKVKTAAVSNIVIEGDLSMAKSVDSTKAVVDEESLMHLCQE